ncbi:Alpha/Beta hydrolase protein [Amylostereum chailletii]|nr:Alpha/Beta hydrolase protein [Amylostereum chailletii]
MSSETPFTIAVHDDKLASLKRKLALTEFPDELEDAGWDYGVPLADIKRLVERWQNGYDWRVHEQEINNTLPMFTRDIDVDGFGALNVHYVHKKSDVANAIPLLFVHGWPGSFLEVTKILPLLIASSPEHPSFNVVALSLPGFSFSEAPKKKGFGPIQIAELANKLMLSLGYSEYVTQGGDWGHWITRLMASAYGPANVKAWHTNFRYAWRPRLLTHPIAYLTHFFSPHTEEERVGLERHKWFEDLGRGYDIQQRTQPQTIGYSVADSPVGLLAWIYEKLVNWTDGYKWDDDEVLTWVSIYWLSRGGPGASQRIYYENRTTWQKQISAYPTIPMGISYFPREICVPPKSWSCTIGKVAFESTHKHGGHFAAHEKPDDLVADLRKMYGKGGPVFGVVPNKSGYA